ncbi:unnamed protein product [Candidula unifasciata]|uniref:Hexosyltransferase n=1 Tax=Candidula unifasciata TaxID=100452 RepID=A0A8S3YY91_9EUPU|nr:unnamed protein product [Candidula unifasciata]
MKVSLKRMLAYLGLRSAYSSSSQVFVSISVISAMPRSRLSRHATKVIVRVSIWTCVVLVLLFLVTYTLLLAFVDRQMHQVPLDVPYKKVRLLNRLYGKQSLRKLPAGNNPFHPERLLAHRKAIWNSSVYYSKNDVLPSCSQPFILFLITSSPQHGDRRMSIRRTWCNSINATASVKQPWTCIFLVGISKSAEMLAQILKEKELYGDILLGSYVDSYVNLTLKVVHGLDWSATHCPSSYVVKTDDDCFVNVRLLYEFLLRYNVKTSALYAGSVIQDNAKLKVIRGRDKKWAVGFQEYPEEYYPPYASGFGYIMSADVVKLLASESRFIVPFPNEDAYVGVLISRLGISPVSSSRFVLSPSGLNVCNYLFVFIVHHVQEADQLALLQKTVESRTVCNHSAITTWS